MKKGLLLFALLLVFTVSRSIAQEVCNAPKIVANTDSENIFTPAQETVFGEMIFQRMSDDIRLIQDEELTQYITNIGDKITKHLPETGLKYKYYLIDMPEANAFNIPGGYVFVSRKLISFSKSEDELAGVMAHELGHAVVRHAASDMSVLFKKILKVEKLGDSKDVADKYNQLIEKARTKTVRQKAGHENKQQIEADELGLFAMVAAGYKPGSFTSFYDRLAETEGKTGSWFSDLFGKTTPSEKRLRKMRDIVEKLPPECREVRSDDNGEDFLNWQASVVSYTGKNRKEILSGLLLKKELTPKLRSDIKHFAVRPDGKYIIAQDDFAVTIIRREPLEVAFQIPALDAQDATFTPDQKSVVFVTDNLRYEKWNIEKQSPVEVRELTLRRDCFENGLSPDGKYLACVDRALKITILDTKTGEKVYEKKEAFELSYFEYFSWILSLSGDSGSFFNITFSPNAKYVVFNRSHRHRVRIRLGYYNDQTENKLIAINLQTFEREKVSKKLKKFTTRPFVFLSPDKIIAIHYKDNDESGIFTFPEGERISKFNFGGDEIKSTGSSKYVIVKPLSDLKLGVFDTEKGVVASGIDKVDGTIWKDNFIYESDSGKVLIRKVKYNEKEKRFDTEGEPKIIDIPVSSISGLYAAELSPNFQWLAISSKSRGGIWNLRTGERKMFVRGFRGAIVGDDGFSVAEFPKNDPVKRSLAMLNAGKNETTIVEELPERGAKQYGRFVLVRKSMEDPKEKEEDKDKDKEEDDGKGKDDKEDRVDLTKNVRFELQDIFKKEVIWSQEFPKYVPGYFFDSYSGRIVLIWRVGSDGGKEKLKEYPKMLEEAKSYKDDEDNYFVEIRDAFKKGEVIGKLLVNTGNRSFSVSGGKSEGNWLILYDTQDRILSYKIDEGTLHQRFFGHYAITNPVKNMLAVENFPGEINLYDLESGDSKGKLIFNGEVIFARFSLNGRILFVLTESQTFYAFDIDKIAKPKPRLAKLITEITQNS